jgi:YbbR domain-containing protein
MKLNLRTVAGWMVENGTYKLVALFITLSLWVFIFERQVSVSTKNLKLDFLLAPSHYIVNNVVREVQFKVKGPRMAVKRFLEGPDSINVDLSASGPGRTMVRIYDDIMELPAKVQVVSVQPSNIYVEIEKREGGK